MTDKELLAASRLWLRKVIEETDIDPEETAFEVSVSGHIVARQTLSEHLKKLDEALA